MVKHIIRLHLGTGKTSWLVQLVNGSTSIMTASELLADLRSRA